MPYIGWIAACFGIVMLAALLERLLRDRAWAAVPIRIHVNGTRGKSTVTRLIWSALREAGIPALAKSTGTAARMLLPDGSEKPWPRRRRANIREQLRLILLARHAGARAVVAECMAVSPELQWTSEQDMVRATIGVITNVRTDHTEVMGHTLEEIAASISGTIPRRSVLVIGDTPFAGFFCARAEKLGTRVVFAPALPRDAPQAHLSWLAEDRAVALAVTRELGIPDAVALAGMDKTLPDPGAATVGVVTLAGRKLPCLDAAAANDPESLDRLVAEWSVREESGPLRLLIVYNHRADRPDRLRRFAAQSSVFSRSGPVLVTGERPAVTLWHLVCRATAGERPRFVPSHRLIPAMAHSAVDVGGVLFCGNTRGLNLAAILEATAHG